MAAMLVSVMVVPVMMVPVMPVTVVPIITIAIMVMIMIVAMIVTMITEAADHESEFLLIEFSYGLLIFGRSSISLTNCYMQEIFHGFCTFPLQFIAADIAGDFFTVRAICSHLTVYWGSEIKSVYLIALI